MGAGRFQRGWRTHCSAYGEDSRREGLQRVLSWPSGAKGHRILVRLAAGSGSQGGLRCAPEFDSMGSPSHSDGIRLPLVLLWVDCSAG